MYVCLCVVCMLLATIVSHSLRGRRLARIRLRPEAVEDVYAGGPRSEEKSKS